MKKRREYNVEKLIKVRRRKKLKKHEKNLDVQQERFTKIDNNGLLRDEIHIYINEKNTKREEKKVSQMK